MKIDSHGGGVVDEGPAQGPITVKFWEDWQDALHFGYLVPWVPRALFWVLMRGASRATGDHRHHDLAGEVAQPAQWGGA